MLRTIEFSTLCDMVFQQVIPAGIAYKSELAGIIKKQKDFDFGSFLETDIYKRISHKLEELLTNTENLQKEVASLDSDLERSSFKIAKELLPLSENIARYCNGIEEMTAARHWPLPTCYDMLFLR